MTDINRFRSMKVVDQIAPGVFKDRIICVDPHGLPFQPGTDFMIWATEEWLGCLLESARHYLDHFCKFQNFLTPRHGDSGYLLPYNQIRAEAKEYLQLYLGLKVKPHVGGNMTVGARKGSVTLPTARLFLQGNRLVYQYLIEKEVYKDPNPFSWEKGILNAKLEFKAAPPPGSGISTPDNPLKRGRMPQTYFCTVNDEWKPKTIDDSSLKNKVVDCFDDLGDRIIARMLFESGARISEVLCLTVGDWRGHAHLYCGAKTINKGSEGVKVKKVYWLPETDRMLFNYFHRDRMQNDRFGRDLKELPDAEPIFINKNGNFQTYSDYYYEWRKSIKIAGLSLTPHQVRHWFVTAALRAITDLAEKKGIDPKLYRQRLINLMHWANPSTIDAYDHVVYEEKTPEFHKEISNQIVVNSQAKNDSQSNGEPTKPRNPGLPPEITDYFESILSSFID